MYKNIFFATWFLFFVSANSFSLEPLQKTLEQTLMDQVREEIAEKLQERGFKDVNVHLFSSSYSFVMTEKTEKNAWRDALYTFSRNITTEEFLDDVLEELLKIFQGRASFSGEEYQKELSKAYEGVLWCYMNHYDGGKYKERQALIDHITAIFPTYFRMDKEPAEKYMNTMLIDHPYSR